MTSTTTPELVSTATLVEELGVDRSTISRWVAADKLTPVVKPKERQSAWFDRADVAAALDAGRIRSRRDTS